MAERILIADDDPVQRRLVENMVQKCGYEAIVVDSGDAAIARLTAADAPAIDARGARPGDARPRRHGRAGEDARSRPRTFRSSCRPRMAASTMWCRRCAPARRISWSSRSASSGCRCRLRNALNASALKGELQRIRHSREGKLTFADIITRSEAMGSVLRTAKKAAGSSIPVLIEGESGVGKELIARAIHGSSDRSTKPFVAVNCGAIPDNLVELILFGHEKGAFTGATERHIGKFVEASGGTLFLDEVSELPLDGAGQAAARAAGRRRRGGRRPQAGQGRRPHHLGDQPQAARPGEGRAIPRGPVLSAARAAADDPAAAGAARGHPASAAAFPGAVLRRGKPRRSPASAAKRWRGWRSSTGPATSASSRTRCTAPW